MGTIGATRLVYGNDAEVFESNGLANDAVLVGETNYKYANMGQYADDEDENEVVSESETETETETVTTTTTRSISTPAPKKKAKFDVVPLITGGGLAYLAHTKFQSNKYSWAYVLGGFTLGYVGGAYLSKAITK